MTDAQKIKALRAALDMLMQTTLGVLRTAHADGEIMHAVHTALDNADVVMENTK